MKKKSKCCNADIEVYGGRGFPLRIICSHCNKPCKIKQLKQQK